MLKFSKANAKLQRLANVPQLQKYLKNKRKIYSLDLLSGWSCPHAKDCLSKVHETADGLRVIDGPDIKFRCYSASQEAIFPAAYKLRQHNLQSLVAAKDKAKLIADSLPDNAGIIRLHSAGDFFNKDYFAAWLKVAQDNPDRLFYAYTKALKFWVDYRKQIPNNMVLTASRGGRLDNLIGKHRLRSVVVLDSRDALSNNVLPVDHTDEHAARPDLRKQNFALFLHGIQPANTEAGATIKHMKKNNVEFSYSRS